MHGAHRAPSPPRAKARKGSKAAPASPKDAAARRSGGVQRGASSPPADVTDPAKVLAATGRRQSEWFAVLDGYGLELDHTQRARRLADEHPDLPGWWCQALTVDFERARGLRVKGQTSKGDFQVSCSKTLPVDLGAAWQRVVETPFLRGADWHEGTTWDAGEARVEVRRVDAGKVLRWFWFDSHGKSTVTLTFATPSRKPVRDAATAPRTAITITHAGLSSPTAAQHYRSRWRQALAQIAAH